MDVRANADAKMSEPQPGDALERARKALVAARPLLLAPLPANLEHSAALVEEAAVALEAVKRGEGGPAGKAAALAECRREALRLAALVEQAWAFSAASLGLAVGVFGYTREGSRAASLAGARVSAEG